MSRLTPEQLTELEQTRDLYTHKVLHAWIPYSPAQKERRQVHIDTRTLYVRSVDTLTAILRKVVRGRTGATDVARTKDI